MKSLANLFYSLLPNPEGVEGPHPKIAFFFLMKTQKLPYGQVFSYLTSNNTPKYTENNNNKKKIK